jgi:hypothetical protein
VAPETPPENPKAKGGEGNMKTHKHKGYGYSFGWSF